jgi:hypothetical protein
MPRSSESSEKKVKIKFLNEKLRVASRIFPKGGKMTIKKECTRELRKFIKDPSVASSMDIGKLAALINFLAKQKQFKDNEVVLKEVGQAFQAKIDPRNPFFTEKKKKEKKSKIKKD